MKGPDARARRQNTFCSGRRTPKGPHLQRQVSTKHNINNQNQLTLGREGSGPCDERNQQKTRKQVKSCHVLAERTLSSKPSLFRAPNRTGFAQPLPHPWEVLLLVPLKAWSRVCSTRESPTLHPGFRLPVWCPVPAPSCTPCLCSLQRAFLARERR